MIKHYSKFQNLGSQNRTSVLLGAQHHIQRLKRISPLSQAFSFNIIARNVEKNFFNQCIDPFKGLPEIFIHTDPSTYVNNQKDLLAILKQTTLERTGDSPVDTVQYLRVAILMIIIIQTAKYVSDHINERSRPRRGMMVSAPFLDVNSLLFMKDLTQFHLSHQQRKL